ncbi:hypothetical protein NIES2135_09300 [Leptolyngbya boryana NIES-2135]|jgi:hypothetical protein|uniref:Uncharacterized protein n=1 Tax=Leptolyngbya boryana NIES-2135 TaxID=1973484 RepID=A0A1Z4JBJ9_LEPBY|nr:MULTISPECIES: hypothetical protein [Leptolyngbya]BAY54116.1 hypothetical protein NIES2135_09300 [Leptolyngbya boryana NIES-2135]MBD2369772.1 hypothetical protein [Leptolyngbya sp. FACHB-161]MBD2376027.1 hypothetical protein [Leptolyngbya sp. FACHB-238]MBD2400303.1 hypothetical protein [Leptolyngbya sp. FACHB-239]MBD2406844.1 hypothetical protein [Leptolyngbya sp. FACHB-402]
MQDAIENLEDTRDLEESEVLTGDRIFDIATFEQKVVLLYRCLSAFLDPTIEPPTLTNVIEAAAYFPFAFLQMRFGDEIYLEKEGLNEEESLKYFYRNLVWRGFEKYLLSNWQAGQEEFGFDEELDTFHSHSDNLSLWHTVVDELVDRIFWDRDWALTSNHPEVLDGIEEELSKPLGLDNYFTNRLPQVTLEQEEVAINEIRNWKLSASTE